jgi:hypothetical protein
LRIHQPPAAQFPSARMTRELDFAGAAWADNAGMSSDPFDMERRLFESSRDARHGARARLFRPIRGGRHLAYPERTGEAEQPTLTFSKDGRSTYTRALEAVQVGDLVHAHPLRDFSRRRGQSNKPVAVHTETTGDLVPCESRLERQLVLLADFDVRVTHIAAQPFTIEVPTGGAFSRHTPDFVVLGRGRVPLAIDVKTPHAAAEPATVERHEAVRAVLSQAGIAHVVWTGVSAVLTNNLALLSKSRVSDDVMADYAPGLLAAATRATPVTDVVASVAPAIGDPAIALVVIRRLIWLHQLLIDLSQPYSPRTLVTSA